MGDRQQRIAVMGDWGYDHIIVPNAHNLSSYKHYLDEGGEPEHVFNRTPGNATNSEAKVEAGSLLTFTLLKGFHDKPEVEFFPKLSKAKREGKSFWSTYSEWLLCEKEQEDSKTHPLWRSTYGWKVGDNPKEIQAIEGFEKYDKLVIRDVFLESGDRSLFDSIENILKQTFDPSHKKERPLVFLRSVVERNPNGKKNVHGTGAKCEADFKNPSIFGSILAKENDLSRGEKENEVSKRRKIDLLKHTVLLLEIGELKTYGAALQDALSWDGLLEETAQTIRQIANFWRYLAVVVSFHGLGALLYLPGGSNQETGEAIEGEFTLVYYPGDIENLTGLNSEDGMFGTTTILHAALAHNFSCEPMANTTDNNSDLFHKNQIALEDAIAAGLYASRELFNKGPLRAKASYDPQRCLYKTKEVAFPVEPVCSLIDNPEKGRDYRTENEKRKERFNNERTKNTGANHRLEKKNCPSLPYIFRVKEGAFISDDEVVDAAEHPFGMYSKPRELPCPSGMYSIPKKSPVIKDRRYPFESILKEALYQAHDYADDLPQSFKVASNLDDAKKWQHHRQKLTLESTDSVSFQLPESSILHQLCKNIVHHGKARYRTVDLFKRRGDGGYPEDGEPIDDVFRSGTPLAIPYLIIGDYLAYDSTEIKQACDINKLLRDFTKDPTRHKPTSICVFGQPGAGKSFLVEQLVGRMKESTDSGLEPELLTFNVSQMKSTEKLIDAWHRVRDAVLRNKLPFVFFDEFDCLYDGKEKLGWLKYFISPMQDGTFVGERGHLHQIGKAVFIFAGGMYESMADFREGIQVGEKREEIRDYEVRKADLRECKQPDFVSRIRGFINVAGPNKRRDGGMLHYLRRATLLRSTLVKKFNIGEDDYIDFDERVFSAFMNVDTYYNNTRSLQSLIELSSCPPNGPLSVSNIYVDDTLDLYVSPDFADYLRGE